MDDWKKKLLEYKKINLSSSSGNQVDKGKNYSRSSTRPSSNGGKKDDMVLQRNKQQKLINNGSNAQKKPRTKFDPIYTGTAALDAYSPRKKTESPKLISTSKGNTAYTPEEFDFYGPAELSINTNFKAPDPWVRLGTSLQASNVRNRKLRVFLGIDFGTSYTKLSIRLQDKVFFPLWCGIHNGSSNYILPSEISEMHDGSLFVGRAKDSKIVHTDLKKSIILDEIRNKDTKLALIAYLAWVMRYARAWLFKEQETLLLGRDLIWNINIGCPTNTYDSSSTYKAYQYLGPIAWGLSQKDKIDKRSAQEAINTELDPKNLSEFFDYHPEFVAQIAGYVKSTQRTNGLHLLLDAGGGTLDFAVFNVYENDYQDIYPIFSSKVSKLGTHYLMSYRFKKTGISSLSWTDQNGIPTTQEFSNYYNIPIEWVQNADDEFRILIRRDIVNTSIIAKNNKVTPYDWQKTATVILAGGGASLEAYRNAFESALNQVSLKHQHIKLAAPDDVTDLDDSALFHRLSVAYGLTFEAGEIRRSCDIEDIPQPKQVIRPDREDIYSR